jgi:hypothetical protein
LGVLKDYARLKKLEGSDEAVKKLRRTGETRTWELVEDLVEDYARFKNKSLSPGTIQESASPGRYTIEDAENA